MNGGLRRRHKARPLRNAGGVLALRAAVFGQFTQVKGSPSRCRCDELSPAFGELRDVTGADAVSARLGGSAAQSCYRRSDGGNMGESRPAAT